MKLAKLQFLFLNHAHKTNTLIFGLLNWCNSLFNENLLFFILNAMALNMLALKSDFKSSKHETTTMSWFHALALQHESKEKIKFEADKKLKTLYTVSNYWNLQGIARFAKRDWYIVFTLTRQCRHRHRWPHIRLSLAVTWPGWFYRKLMGKPRSRNAAPSVQVWKIKGMLTKYDNLL